MNAGRSRSNSKFPQFTKDGVLPIGDYALTLSELRDSPLVMGSRSRSEHWDIAWRRHLVDNLSVLVRQLWQVGVAEIFIDGSFVEEKDHPNDIDGYFECDVMQFASGKLEDSLNRLDPHQAWTWDPASRQRVPGFDKKQLPMWCQYRVELFPHYGQPSGIRDLHGNLLEFPSPSGSHEAESPRGSSRLCLTHDSH